MNTCGRRFSIAIRSCLMLFAPLAVPARRDPATLKYKEPTMDNIHRIISTVIAPRSGALATAAPTTRRAAGPLPYSASGRLASDPWMGLYLELDD